LDHYSIAQQHTIIALGHLRYMMLEPEFLFEKEPAAD
jgi:hypothetical protein